MFKNNKNLFVIAVIAVVNALGYGIIIPILYSYSKRFGLTDFQNGLLFSVFSVCQFISTPFIGRLSDKYGRKPLLILSLVGTAVSFFMMAFAQNALFLFVARALDGITAGNIPVASAVISDTTEMKDRAKGFGIIGASFGFGFMFGPVISTFTIGLGPSVPFLIAGLITIAAVLLTAVLLPETNIHMGEVRRGALFNFSRLWHALFDKNVGLTLLITLLYSIGFGLFIYAFQPFSVRILHLTAREISAIFTVFGLIGLVSQMVIVPKITARFGDKRTLSNALFLTMCAFAAYYVTKSLSVLVIVTIFQSFGNGFVNPLIQSLLSKESDAKSQGEILGLNASYMSIGFIVGPVVGGALATISIPMPFLLGSVMCAVCFYLSLQILRKPAKKLAL